MREEVVVVAHPGSLGMELLGVCDLFGTANWSLGIDGAPARYQVRLAAPAGEAVPLWGAGLSVGPTDDLREFAGAPADGQLRTVVVVGGPDTSSVAADDAPLVDAVRVLAPTARRLVGICTGTFLLGAAGLLDGRRCTTHWEWSADLAARFPLARVDAEAVVVRDGELWTSGGVTAGFDLLLALLTEDLGAEVTRRVARRLVLYLRRSGLQSQFATGERPSAQSAQVRAVQHHVTANLGEDLSAARLAAVANLSPRHLARVFLAETGVTPGRFVEQARTAEARQLLETTSDPVESVARAAGFSGYRSMHRAFVTALGVPPAEYRRRFGVLKMPR